MRAGLALVVCAACATPTGLAHRAPPAVVPDDAPAEALVPLLGNERPYVLVGVAEDGAWLLVEQPHDVLRFIRAAHPDQLFDSLVATDPRGRYFAAARGETLVLVETATGAETLLAGAAVRTPPARKIWGGRGGAATFGALGDHIAYVAGDRTRIVVRRLHDGDTHEIAAGAEIADNDFGFGEGDQALVMHVASHVAVAMFATSASADAPSGFVTALGDGYVTRRDDASLQLRTADHEIPLTPAACGGVIQGGDPIHLRALIRCRDGALHACGLDGCSASLAMVPKPPYTVDRLDWSSDPLVRVSDEPVMFYDTERERVITLGADEGLLDVFEDKLLFVRHGELRVRDIAANTDHSLGPAPKKQNSMTSPHAVVSVGDTIVDIAHEQVLGTYPRPWLALSSKRQFLYAREMREEPGVGRVPRGPFWWEPIGVVVER
ncbi:MAG TPA: hypothetical protein VGM39_09575 [Kofleriaceae bacterium]|jgi:hypothetical protein